MPSVTSVRMRSFSSSVGQGLAGPRQRQLAGAPRRRSSRAARTRCSSSRSGAYAAMSASCPGVSTPASTSPMRRAPRCSRIVSTTARYSLASSRARVGRLRVVDRLDLHVQRAFVADGAGAHAGPADAADHQRERAVGQLAGVLDLGDRADLRVAAVDPGHEHQAAPGLLGRGAGPLGLVGLERDRHDHLREHDALRERQQRQQLGAGSFGSTAGRVDVDCESMSLLGHCRCPVIVSGTFRVTPLQRRGSRVDSRPRQVEARISVGGRDRARPPPT